MVGFRHDDLQHWGAALTFYSVLSIFPALLLMVALVGLLADPARVTDVLTKTVTELGPKTAATTVEGPVDSVTSHRGTASAMFIVSGLAALWAASGYLGALSAASNVIYQVDEGRPFAKRKPTQLLVTFLIIMLAGLVALALVLSGPLVVALGKGLGIGETALFMWRLAKWPVMAALVLAIIDVLYYVAPNARIATLRWFSGGSVLALIIWALASWGFDTYVSHFGSYDKTYGALGGVVVMLVWLWLTNMAILLGAKFNAEVERAREMASGIAGADRRLRVPEREQPDGAPRRSDVASRRR